MGSLNFKQFQAKTVAYKHQDFPCVIEEIPAKVIPHLESQGETFCFLESAVQSVGKGKYSILAFGVHHVIAGENIFDEIDSVIKEITHLTNEELPMIGSLYGYISYNSVTQIEPTVHCGNATLIPKGFMFLPKNILVIDNFHNLVHIASIFTENSNVEEVFNFLKQAIKEHIPFTPSENSMECEGIFHDSIGFYSNTSKEEYCKIVEKSIEYIKKGDIFQIVPSIRFYKKYNKHPLEFYQNLRSINPSPYMFYFSSFHEGERFNIIGASPEILINCKNGEITLRPLAGTIKRGLSEEEDAENARLLLANEKEVAEHLMLLDLGRNDAGRVGYEIYVEKHMEVERYSHVMHISSTVKGKKEKNVTMVDILKAGLPAGTLSGAPKIRAMQIIAELEHVSRDFYAGTVGYISHSILQTCIVLRSALIKDGIIYAQAGAGVVFDSIPENEYEECVQKATAIAKASL